MAGRRLRATPQFNAGPGITFEQQRIVSHIRTVDHLDTSNFKPRIAIAKQHKLPAQPLQQPTLAKGRIKRR